MIRAADDVAWRALCLLALVTRAQIEADLRASPAGRPRWAGLDAGLRAWLRDEDLLPRTTPLERRLLSAELGSWTAEEVRDQLWRLEALAALAFALGALGDDAAGGLPAFDQAVDADELLARLPLLRPTQAFVQGAALLDEHRIDRARRAAGVWAWRAKTELLRRKGGKSRSGESGLAVVERGAKAALQAGMVAELVDGDVPFRGRAMKDVGEGFVLEAATIALERGAALEWTLGRKEWEEGEAIL